MSEAEDDVPIKTPSNKMMLIILLTNIVGLGAIGAFLGLTRSTPAHSAPAPERPRHHVGPMVPMEPLIINIGGVGESGDDSRYLKVTVQFEAASEVSKTEIETALVPIRSRLLIRFASLTLPEAQGTQNLLKLQGEVKQIVNQLLGSPRVAKVHFTDFVVQ
ncbi:MAG: flagellar basal body-associated FliL family protein [Deltaproteobacteria bacterium]|nr:flagellar basal body-associated FliL family protein [Deltaproteobacteria bacterium]